MTRFIILLLINALAVWVLLGPVFKWGPRWEKLVEQAIARLGMRLWVALLAVSFAAVAVIWVGLVVELIQAGLALTRAAIC